MSKSAETMVRWFFRDIFMWIRFTLSTVKLRPTATPLIYVHLVDGDKLRGVLNIAIPQKIAKYRNTSRGGVGIFGFADLANFWFGFAVFALKTAVFRFWCLVRFAGFLQYRLWFLPTIMVGFQIFLPNAFYGFSGFVKEVTPCSPAKTLIPRDWPPVQPSTQTFF